MVSVQPVASASSSHGRSLLGDGWQEVPSFDDLDEDDDDEYESEEEVCHRSTCISQPWSATLHSLTEVQEFYAVLDLGNEVDAKTLMTEGTYQLIGIETPTPYIRLGDHILRGEVSTLVGEEVILGLHRNVLPPSHPPLYKTTQRISFRPVALHEPSELPASSGTKLEPGGVPSLVSPKKVSVSTHNLWSSSNTNAEAGPSRQPLSAAREAASDEEDDDEDGDDGDYAGSVAATADDEPKTRERNTGRLLLSARGGRGSRGGGTSAWTGKNRGKGRPLNPERRIILKKPEDLLHLDFRSIMDHKEVRSESPGKTAGESSRCAECADARAVEIHPPTILVAKPELPQQDSTVRLSQATPGQLPDASLPTTAPASARPAVVRGRDIKTYARLEQVVSAGARVVMTKQQAVKFVNMGRTAASLSNLDPDLVAPT